MQSPILRQNPLRLLNLMALRRHPIGLSRAEKFLRPFPRQKALRDAMFDHLQLGGSEAGIPNGVRVEKIVG